MDFSELAKKRQDEATQKIDAELTAEHNALMTTRWADVKHDDPILPLPEWILDDYKKAVLDTPPEKMQVLSDQHFKIAHTPADLWCFGQVGIVVSIFAFCRPYSFCTVADKEGVIDHVASFDLYVSKRRTLDALMMQHHDIMQQKNESLSRSKQFRMSLFDQNTWMPKSTSKFHA